MMVAKEKLLLKEMRKKKQGIKTMTKEQIMELRRRKEEEEEQEEKEEIIEVDPVAVRKAEYCKEKGTSFFKMNDFHGALKMYEESLKWIPDSPIVLTNLSIAQIKLGKFVEAINSANKALQLSEGTHTKAWYRRGQAFLGMGDFENAYQDFG
jgi:tetratricopeptide (TPR) repeat protein